jgi:methanogenic corrinoid protein MtbC1
MSPVNKTSIFDEIAKSVYELEGADKTVKFVEKALKEKYSATEIIEKGLKKGLDEVGRRYEKGEYFLSELLYAGDIMKSTLEMLGPYMKQDKIEEIGAIVLGTVRGDIHDIGKNIFATMAQFSGFKIYDLGVDVDPKTFVNEIKKTGANVLALSTLLTSTLPEVKIVIEELKKAGIRDKVKVIIGGNAVTKQFAKEVGADAGALDAVQGLEICKRWKA